MTQAYKHASCSHQENPSYHSTLSVPKKMRKMDIFCASPASTAICSGVDHRSMVRHHHLTPRSVPCSSHLPITPKPYNNIMEKTRKSSASSASKHHGTTTSESRRKSSADAYDLARRIISHRSRRPGDSTRYLLSDITSTTTATTTASQDRFNDWLSDHQNQSPADTKPPPVSVRRHQSAKEPRHLMLSENHDSPKLVKSSSRPDNDQVVVLRVSLHCKGCEGKVRKHISKMEGVRSFSIEFDTKKVTVIGNVTAAGVLASLSRVKNAQLWPSPTSSSSSSSSTSSYSSSATTRTPSSLSS